MAFLRPLMEQILIAEVQEKRQRPVQENELDQVVVDHRAKARPEVINQKTDNLKPCNKNCFLYR